MINRKVFIIKGHSKSEREKVIDEYYASWYLEFFTSCAGGAYLLEEVKYFSEPTHSLLRKEVEKEKLDYGIIVYIGHGANQDDNQLFQLNVDEVIKPGQFILNSEKQIIVLDFFYSYLLFKKKKSHMIFLVLNIQDFI